MKKKSVFFIVYSIILCEIFASDISLFNEINLSFKNKFYPGTVEKVHELEKNYPESVYLQKALLLKAQSLVEMSLYDDAIEALQKVLSQTRFGSSEYSNCNFLFGKVFYLKGDGKKALNYFYEACNSSLTSKNLEYYNPSVFYSAQIFYSLEDYKNAIPLFEYILYTPESCSSNDDYYDCLQKTMICYNKTENHKKTISLYKNLEKDKLPQNVYLTLCIYAADALSLDDKNLEAYDLYCEVINNSEGNLAVIALKKAYVLASEKKIGVNTGAVFSKTVDKFKDNEELVNEFWIRLGIDEFDKGNYKKASDYFSNVSQNNVIVMFYNAKIQIDDKNNPALAEQILENILQKIESKSSDNQKNDAPKGTAITEQNENANKNNDATENAVKNNLPSDFSDKVNSLLLLAKIQQKKWDEMVSVFEKIKHPSKEDIYNVSASYYAKGEYDKVSPSSDVLYASSLSRSGNLSKAAEVFKSLELDSKGHLEYAKLLFRQKKYIESYNEALLSYENDKEYICGLCQINLKNWNLAKSHFSSYIKQNSSKQDFNILVFFYKGYAEYCLEEYKNAYASFIRFNSEAIAKNQKNNALFDDDIANAQTIQNHLRKSYEYAAKSALQNSDFKNAAIQAENLIKYSQNKEEKQNAVLFCAEIFADYADYDNALNILLQYSTVSDNKNDLNYDKDFVSKVLFNCAKIYELCENLEKADYFYTKVYKDFPDNKLSQEALYRNAGVFYSVGDYASAFNKFNEYIYNYVSGEFVDAALYFGGDCAIKLGEIERSIIFNQTLLKQYPKSVYVYGANINLLAAFYQKEDYSQALQIAKNLVKKFPKESADDEIGTKLIELERIVQGTDRRIVEKQSEYEKNGKSSTVKGRICGSELVKLLAENPLTQKDAFLLAEEILQLQTSDDEKTYAAQNAEFIADYYRKNQKNKDAASMYLKAAEFYRTFDDSKSAITLYSAVEAFLADNYVSDADAVSKLLKELYPQSRQAQRVDRLFEK